MFKALTDLIKQFREAVRATGAQEIARRLFVTNSFDGLLTVLGILLGSVTVGVREPTYIIGACIGGSIAMGISGFTGTFLSERAERVRELKELERVMLADLDESIYGRAARIVPFYVAVYGSAGIMLPPLTALVPFILCEVGLVPFSTAFIGALAALLLLLFLLGAYLGKVAEERILLSGLRMVGVGLVTAIAVYLISLLFSH